MYLATSRSSDNLPLIEEARKHGLKIYAGEEEDVVERYLSIGEKEGADALLRIGCDKPLFSIEIASQLISSYNGEDNLTVASAIGVGVGCEIVSTTALKVVHERYSGTAITQYIKENIYKFKTRGLEVDKRLCRPEYRLALDTQEDYEMHCSIYKSLYNGMAIPLKEVYLFLDDNPQIANINSNVKEKNVNIYIGELRDKPVFSVYKLASGKYVAYDALKRQISYDDLIDVVKKKEEWLSGNE